MCCSHFLISKIQKAIINFWSLEVILKLSCGLFDDEMREHFSLLYDQKNESPGGNHFFPADFFRRPDRFKCEQNKKVEVGLAKVDCRETIKIPFWVPRVTFAYIMSSNVTIVSNCLSGLKFAYALKSFWAINKEQGYQLQNLIRQRGPSVLCLINYCSEPAWVPHYPMNYL